MTTRLLILLMGLWMNLSLAGETPAARNEVLAPYLSDLVVLENNQLVPLKPDQFLRSPYTILYYSAGWCPDCRLFSPALVNAYNAQTNHPRGFEVLLMPMDKTEADMLKYMRQEKMNWPALAFAKTGAADDLKKYYSGEGIPCLTVIDSKGKIILQSKSDQDAKQVLNQLHDLINASSPSPQPGAVKNGINRSARE